MRGIPLDRPRPERDPRYPRVPRPTCRRTRLVGHRTLGEKVLDTAINWKLAIDTFAENYHFATMHKTTLATIARSNCTVFDSFGLHHRLVFPLNGILDLDEGNEAQWDLLQNMVVIYALFPNIVLSATIANGELFRVYPGDAAGRSITVHQNSTPLNLSEEWTAAGAQAVFEYAHGTVRDEDYALVEKATVQPRVRRAGAPGVRLQRARPATSSSDVDRSDQPVISAMARATSSRSPGPAASSTSASSQSRYNASDRS